MGEEAIVADGERPLRVGDVELGHGSETVLLMLLGRWPGSTQLTPDEADALAGKLHAQAAAVRGCPQHEAVR